MFFQVLLCSLLLGVAVAERNFEYTRNAKECMDTIGVKEEAIRRLVPEKEGIPINDETVLKFFECLFKNFLDDKSNLIVNDQLREYVEETFSMRMKDAKKPLVRLVADDCISRCRDIRDQNRGVSAVKIMNCLKDRLQMYVNV